MASKNHIDNWILRAEPDYYTMFVKAWIPFNAWYYTEYNTKKDNVAIKELCGTKNKVRNRIEALLLNNDIDSKDFRHHLAQLQKELSSRTILNYGQQVSFEYVTLSDYFPSPETFHENGIIYKAIPNKNSGFRATVVAKDNSKTYMDKNFNPFDINSLILDNQYIALNSKMKDRIKKVFSAIDPSKPINLISKSKTKSEYILLDNEIKIKFVNDTELIAKAVIQILYTLRCLLFHGELDPTEINHAIYKHGFNLIIPIIKELK